MRNRQPHHMGPGPKYRPALSADFPAPVSPSFTELRIARQQWAAQVRKAQKGKPRPSGKHGSGAYARRQRSSNSSSLRQPWRG